MIYKIRPHGQMVNEACQWIVEYRDLTMRLAVIPVLILAGITLINIILFNSVLIYVLLFLAAVLLIPVLPCFVMEVAENPEEYDYPNRIPRLFELRHRWWFYFSKVLVINVLGGIASLVTSFTIVGPLAIPFFTFFATAIAQRDDESGIFSAIGHAISYTFNNFANSLMVFLGVTIINYSMIIGPYVAIIAITAFLKEFVSNDILGVIHRYFSGSSPEAIGALIIVVCAVFAYMTTTVIYHFFYGHCVAKEHEFDKYL